MKVLLISSNTLPAAPSGPVYLAGAVRQAGHDVQIFECLFASDLVGELKARLQAFLPDVIGVSIRLVFGDEIDPGAYLGTRHTDLRQRVKEVIDILRHASTGRIVLGGPGFNYYTREWLEYLDLDYGIRGEGEESFPLFLQRLEEGGDIHSIPGCVYREGDGFGAVPPCPVENLDGQALPAYDLLDWRPYASMNVNPTILTKRGCAFTCTYCPYSKLEGKRYRLKSPERVLAEARHIRELTGNHRVMFCENNFNAPRAHAQAILKTWVAEEPGIQWGTGDLRPVGITADFSRLMEDSGCFYANLSVESASERMLRSMRRGYTVSQVRASLDALSRSKIPFSASLMLGAPGESPETITETLAVLDDFGIPDGVWVTIGVYLWTDYQDLVVTARQSGFLKSDKALFSGAVYLSPSLPKSYLLELTEMLRAKPGYAVQFNKPNESWRL
jgi:radical SAM superfamily enzyme YgiQ (UPF0313 family)